MQRQNKRKTAEPLQGVVEREHDNCNEEEHDDEYLEKITHSLAIAFTIAAVVKLIYFFYSRFAY